jgi:hypothetical protein
MDTTLKYTNIIKEALNDLAVPFAVQDLRNIPVFDDEHKRYLLITTGTDEGKQVHEIMCSVELTPDSKVKIIYNTSDDDLEHTFKRRGISPQDIIL